MYASCRFTLDRFPTSRMLEVNSHSLFSKWFSESGKLVQQLFDHINTTLEDNDTFVTVLIGPSQPTHVDIYVD
jgi:hypothetical protein